MDHDDIDISAFAQPKRLTCTDRNNFDACAKPIFKIWKDFIQQPGVVCTCRSRQPKDRIR